jgi:transposase
MVSSEIKQTMKMKFCFKLGKTATEIHEMLVRVYIDAVSRKTVYKWFERYGGAESTDDEQRSGLASTSTTEENVENQRNGLSRQKIDDLRNI